MRFSLEHINHIVDQIGHDYVGIGSDFDGIDRYKNSYFNN